MTTHRAHTAVAELVSDLIDATPSVPRTEIAMALLCGAVMTLEDVPMTDGRRLLIALAARKLYVDLVRGLPADERAMMDGETAEQLG